MWAQRLSESFGPALREGAASLINAPQPEDDVRSPRITVGEQLHRSLEVGEEHGDLLSLTFEGGL